MVVHGVVAIARRFGGAIGANYWNEAPGLKREQPQTLTVSLVAFLCA
jgi:hypothetical protein